MLESLLLSGHSELLFSCLDAFQEDLQQQTGFIHHEHSIPLLENFCYGFALFLKRTRDDSLAAQKQMEKLLFFQSPQGLFPRFLHDFPNPGSTRVNLLILYMLKSIEKEFSKGLEPRFLKRLQESRQFLLEGLNKSSLEFSGALACLKNAILEGSFLAFTPKNANEWGDYVFSALLCEKERIFVPWNQSMGCFLPTVPQMHFQKGEPERNAVDYYLMDQCGLGLELKGKKDRNLQLACLFPQRKTLFDLDSQEKIQAVHPNRLERRDHHAFLALGKAQNSIQSCAIYSELQQTSNGLRVIIDEPFSSEEKSPYDLEIFFTYSPKAQFLIDGEQGNVFYPGQNLCYRTEEFVFELRIEIEHGKGDYVGHLLKKSRPSETHQGIMECYDYCLALRPIRREREVSLRIDFAMHNCQTSTTSIASIEECAG